MFNQSNRPASALLLTVMIIAILTTTTLASIAVRFDQLASTDKVANATVAKSAADSALVKLKEKLATSTTITPTTFDLDKNEETASIPTPFRPSPRKIVSTYEKISTSLPRCNGVIVLLPWTNDGQYLLNQTNDSNPAMIFNYANIVNDTPLGIIPGNGGLPDTDKDKTVSQLTNMGHFYNPFAPVGAKQKDLNYWTVKLGGPQDQFLTKKDTDGASSFYKNVDFVYLPYLPRWSDSGLFTSTPGTKVDRISASTLQTKFETTIKENNFKVWIDASISDAQLYQYGFGDLFVTGTAAADYRLKWLQPSLWNDTPEADSLSTPYKTEDAENAALNWAKKSQPVMTLGANDNGWDTAIVKGAKSFSFIKLSGNPTFSPNSIISGLIYGSLEGLRLDQSITLVLLDKNQQPLSLQSRNQDQGRLYNVKLTKIGPTTISNGIESVSVTFKLGDTTYSTPLKSTGIAVSGNDIDTIAVAALPQFSTAISNKNVTINTDADGLDVTIATSSNCSISTQLTACPAVGDLVSLTKSGSTPVWGKVTKTNFNAFGTTLDSFVLDKLHKSPLPTREMAYTYFDQGGPKIAYYGGAVNMNDYDGGYASESAQLWIYDPEADTWTFPTQTNGTPPGKRAGASMVYDSVNQRLVMLGGYYHQPINIDTPSINCETAQSTCLYTNRPGLRVAKRVTNDVFAFSLTTNTWEKITYPTLAKIKTDSPDNTYTVRVTSTLADRSGLERWNWAAKTQFGQNQTLKVDGTESNIDLIVPTTAGIAKGDEVYLYGNKSDDSSFYAWAKVNSIIHHVNMIWLTVYGYKPALGETSITMKTLAVQVVKRQITTDTCVGGQDAVTQKYFCQFSSGADTTGYAVGDSVVLEQYALDGTTLNGTLSGFINYLGPTGKAYFVSDETKSAVADFTILDQNAAIAASDSAVAFPSARYGASFALQPLTPTKASYWEGTAKNINYQMRFADLWNVEFKDKALFPGAASAVWSFQSTTNDTSALSTAGSYRFQVIKSNYSYQIPTSASTANNPEIIKVTQIDPKTGDSIVAWDNNQRWQLEIASTDAPKVVTGAWATLERRLSNGTRETFHGIVENNYASPPPGCTAYATTKLCLRHNSSFPNDSGFAGDSAGVKVTMSPTFSPSDAVGGTFGVDIAGGKVTLQNVPNSNFGRVPGLGATVMIWRDPIGASPTDAYTFIVKDRTFSGNTFSFFFDKIIASPHPFGYSSSQIASSGGTDRLVTITDHQMDYYDSTNAPEWVKDVASGAWKIRLAAKNPNLLYRPSPRRAGAVASIYTSGIIKGNPVPGTSQVYLTGGTFGQFGSLWKQNDAGAITTNAPAWTPRYVSANSTEDIPNLFGSSLVAYKSGGLTKLVYFGGKQKTDISSADYGSSVGAKMLGRPDNGSGTQNDNSFYITDNFAANDPNAVAITNTIESNQTNWPSTVGNSLKFDGGDRDGGTVCAYLGQINSSCSSKLLLSQLGSLGRNGSPVDPNNNPYNGWTWGRSAILTELGDRFKSQTVDESIRASLIMSVPTLSGSGVNGRWDQEGYRPYCKDNASGGCLNLAGASAYGKLATDFGSDKTAGLVAYTAINNATDKGGAILATSVGVGNAIASSRGGSTGTAAGWYSYCAASELKKTEGVIDLNPDGTYICQSTASRYLPTLPDAEDLLFLLNAAQALGATDTYKVVGYYGGVKRGYLVTSVSGTLPKVYEIVP